MPESQKHGFFIDYKNDADFAIQRVGVRAGLIRTKDFLDYSEESHYFIWTVINIVLTGDLLWPQHEKDQPNRFLIDGIILSGFHPALPFIF